MRGGAEVGPAAEAGPFSRRTLALLAGGSAASFALGIALTIFGPEVRPVASAGADGFSRSAVGHLALVEVLRALEVPVVLSRSPTPARDLGSALLVLAAPDPDELELRPEVFEAGATARAVLLVLPKWSAREDPARPGWVRRPELVPPADVARVLSAAGVEGTVARPLPGPAPGEYERGPFAAAPALDRPQLLRTSDLEPLIAAADGLLLGEADFVTEEGGTLRLAVLSDPDLLATHALGRGENAALAVEVIDRLRGPGGVVVFDETVHGHEAVPSIWRELFGFPLVLALVQAALALAALLWAGVSRFGSPVPAAAALAPGKGPLVENTAALLQFAGHSPYALSRYLSTAVREVAEALHAPADLEPRDLRAWLDRAGAARGAPAALARVDAAVGRARRESEGRRGEARGAAILAAARLIHEWRGEMLHGRAGDPRSR